jgi:hypothetical protein
MKKTLPDRIAALAAMDVPALREEHHKVFGKEPVRAHRQFLFRKIAWRLQADEEGRQPDALHELARGIARNSPLRNQRQVLDDGRFSYDDREFKSLSAIAQEITGTKWNGLLFFGLTEKKKWPQLTEPLWRCVCQSDLAPL